MAIISLTVLRKELAAIMEAGPDDNTFAVASTDQGAFTDDEITSAILKIDAEVCSWIMDTPHHGFRDLFLANSADLANGAKIPAHVGKLGTVEIKLADASYVLGEEAPSVSALRMWQSDTTTWPAVDVQGRYVIADEHKVYFIGSAMRVQYCPRFVIDRATPACQGPEELTAVVLRGSVAAMPRKFSLELVRECFDEYRVDEMRIKGGAKEVPPFRRVAA